MAQRRMAMRVYGMGESHVKVGTTMVPDDLVLTMRCISVQYIHVS